MKYLILLLRVVLGVAIFFLGGVIVTMFTQPLIGVVPNDVRFLIALVGGGLILFFSRGLFSKLDRFDKKPPIYKATPQITHIETTSTKPSDLEEEAQKTIRNCPKCRTSITSEALFCTSCGTDLRLKTCLNCDTENPTEATFCMSCGKELSTA